MAREQIENLVEKLAKDITSGTELEVVDVEFVKECEWYLRVFLDKSGGIEMEDCQWVSEKLESEMDKLDPIKESYYLEVSSPGLDRPLKKERDFMRHQGDKVEVHTFEPIDGQKTVVGTLLGLDDGNIQMKVDGYEISIPKDKASQVKLYIEF